MRNRAFAAALLIFFVAAAFAPAAVAAQALFEPDPSETVHDIVESLPDASEAGSEDDPAETELRESAAARASEESVETSPEPPAEPGTRLSLEVDGSSSTALNEETPAVLIRWSNGTPADLAGYVWSFGNSDSALSIFNISYDSQLSSLPAGSLNGQLSAAGSYILRCQAIDIDQEPIGPFAQIVLHVEQPLHQLTITANRNFPVAAGTSVDLVPSLGDSASRAVRYEWKPSGTVAANGTCRVASVAPGSVRYTCTAVLEGGSRITATTIVTGTELVGSRHLFSISDPAKEAPLTVSWSNGAPSSGLSYVWGVRDDTRVDLSHYTGMQLPASALSDLAVRSNPYTVTCQAYRKGAPLGQPVTFHVSVQQQVRRTAGSILSSGSAPGPLQNSVPAGTVAAQQDTSAAQEPSGVSPDTDDSGRGSFLSGLFTLLGAFLLLTAEERLRKKLLCASSTSTSGGTDRAAR